MSSHFGEQNIYAKVNAWRQHAQAWTGGEMVTALVELERVGEIKYLKEKNDEVQEKTCSD